MFKRASSWLAVLAVGFLCVSAAPVLRAGPGVPKALRVQGTVHVFKNTAVCALEVKNPNDGLPVPNLVVKINNTPLVWQAFDRRYHAEFPVAFAAPINYTVTLKLPSPPFDPGVSIVATATIPTVAAFVKPVENETFNRGVGPGVGLMWRITPSTSPVQIMLTDMTDNMNYFFEGVATNPYVLPWASIPGHAQFKATVRSFQNVHFKFTGPVTPDSAIHAMSYGMVQFKVASLAPFNPPATIKRETGAAPVRSGPATTLKD